MDGVLADFDKFVLDNYGRTFPQDTHVDDTKMWEYLESIDHFYFKLEPTPYAYRLYHLACFVADDVQILTAIPSRGQAPTAKEDKQAWVNKYFSNNLRVNFGPYSKDKWKHALPGDILIDDRPDNIHSWNAAGGIGILHNYFDFDKTVEKLLDAVKK
jgi:hypothetical protein